MRTEKVHYKKKKCLQTLGNGRRIHLFCINGKLGHFLILWDCYSKEHKQSLTNSSLFLILSASSLVQDHSTGDLMSGEGLVSGSFLVPSCCVLTEEGAKDFPGELSILEVTF
jgi:hypothetical protein